MSRPLLGAPFPWFGGKSMAAALVWSRFGAVENYVEPFCGSAAILLAAPNLPAVVTLNDADGFLVNFWRAVKFDPVAVARWLDYPVTEIDLFARHVWLVNRAASIRRQLETDPEWYDTQAAGWWCWGQCAWIGTGWCSGTGPWTVLDGDIRQLPHLGNPGRGVNRQLPHLGNPGRGVNRQLPHLGDPGRGSCNQRAEHLLTYMGALADALRTARITCGAWSRVVTGAVTDRHGITAIFLDPPYGEGEQEYSAGGNRTDIASKVWQWAIEAGENQDLRIAVCAYEDGRAVLPRWSVGRWRARKGYQTTEKARTNPAREVIYFSPHCIADNSWLPFGEARVLP